MRSTDVIHSIFCKTLIPCISLFLQVGRAQVTIAMTQAIKDKKKPHICRGELTMMMRWYSRFEKQKIYNHFFLNRHKKFKEIN